MPNNASPTAALPDTLDACHALIEQVHDTNESLARDIERLKFESEQLKRYIYGRRSERHVEDGAQLKLFADTAQIILGKYADHLPLYRMEDIFARAGVVIPRSTQVGLLDMAADLCQPLIDLIHRRLLSSGVLGLDDTPVRLQDNELPGAMRTARMWLCRGRDEAPYNQFFFHDSRGREGPAKFLQDYRGWVTVDAYGVNDGVYLGSGERILASCCHAHARRKFEAAKSNDPRRAS